MRHTPKEPGNAARRDAAKQYGGYDHAILALAPRGEIRDSAGELTFQVVGSRVVEQRWHGITMATRETRVAKVPAAKLRTAKRIDKRTDASEMDLS